MFQRTSIARAAAAVCLINAAWAQLTNTPDSFRFAVIGDTGTGGRQQYDVGARLAEFLRTIPFRSVIMLGDNLYGSQTRKDYRQKFELPYASLLDAGVDFYAVLGNHDRPSQQSYPPFHMNGRRYYTFCPHEGVRFFGLDSTHLDRVQLKWFEQELAGCKEGWKIVFLHHPMYSSGAKHGSNLPVRSALEPLLVKYDVAVALAGHDHFYERSQPQKAVTHFVVGGAASVRVGNARRSAMTAVAFDRDSSFLLMEIGPDAIHFQAVSRNGETVDTGSISKASLR